MRMHITQIPRIITTSRSLRRSVIIFHDCVSEKYVRNVFVNSSLQNWFEKISTPSRRKTKLALKRGMSRKLGMSRVKNVPRKMYDWKFINIWSCKRKTRKFASNSKKDAFNKNNKKMYHIAPNTNISTAFRVV